MQDKKVTPPFIRSANNYDMNHASQATALECKDPSLAQQQFAEESDINYIADRFGLTGEMPQVLNMPRYGDFTGIFDFQSAQNAVIEATRQFMTLPAKIRTRFNNDPQQLLTWLEDDTNREEAEWLGLAEKRNLDDPGEPQAPSKGAAKATEDEGLPTPPAKGPKAAPTPKSDT